MYHIFKEQEDGWFCFVNGSTVSMWVEELPELLDSAEITINPSFLELTPQQIADKTSSVYRKSSVYRNVIHFCSVEKLSDLIELYPELFL